MIVYDLACAAGGHVFEGWFGSSADYADQRARGLLSCPMCGGDDVDRAAMAPRIAGGGGGGGGGSGDGPAVDPKRALAMLAAAQAKALAGSDYVGDSFASEARRIHDGDCPERRIHGRATIDEARALHADGVPVAPLPLPVRAPGTDN